MPRRTATRHLIVLTGVLVSFSAVLGAEKPAKPAGAGSPEEIALRQKLTAGIRRRFDADLAAIEKAINESKASETAKSDLLARVKELGPRLRDSVPAAPPSDFKTIFPMNAQHAEVFRLQAALWKNQRRAAITAWAVCPWDPTQLFAPPEPLEAGKAMQVHLMRGEYRCAAFNLANASDSPMEVRFRFSSLPGGTAPPYISACRVPWTDTINGTPAASALVELPKKRGEWKITVLPGLTQQIWLTLHVTNVPAGQYDSNLEIAAAGQKEIVLPFSLRVYPFTFPKRTSLLVGGWSYTDGPGLYGITPVNHAELVRHLREHFVNAPWATANVLTRFSFKGDLIELDTRRMDDWLAQWPDARMYFSFVSSKQTFAGSAIGTPEFNRKVGIWITAWVRHLASRGISADRFGLLLVDEPQTQEADDVIVAWAKAIHAAQPKVQIWEDPLYRDPSQGKPEMFALSDILCPNRPMWLSSGPAFEKFYRDQQKAGRTLQFYSCSGPAAGPVLVLSVAGVALSADRGDRFVLLGVWGQQQRVLLERVCRDGGSVHAAVPRREVGHASQADGGDSRERGGLRVLRDAGACGRAGVNRYTQFPGPRPGPRSPAACRRRGARGRRRQGSALAQPEGPHASGCGPRGVAEDVGWLVRVEVREGAVFEKIGGPKPRRSGRVFVHSQNRDTLSERNVRSRPQQIWSCRAFCS